MLVHCVLFFCFLDISQIASPDPPPPLSCVVRDWRREGGREGSEGEGELKFSSYIVA